MESGTRRHRMMDLGTALMVLAAVALVVEDRLLPAWRASRVVEVGEAVPDGLRVRTLASGDTLTVAASMPTLLLFYRSDCPACARAAPAWRDLVARAGGRLRPLAVGLEDEGPALAWVRSKLPRSLGVRPLAPDDFLHRLAVRRVPSTLLVGADDRLLYRRSAVPTAAVVDSLLALTEVRAPIPDR